MPKGPNGETRPADAIGCAVNVARIATGDEKDTFYVSKNRHKSGVAGAKARMQNTDAARRTEIAANAASVRWKEEANMNEHHSEGIASLYQAKRNAGLVDVKFLHKNLDEASPAQLEADLLRIHAAIAAGKTKLQDFGDLRLKKAN
jgi:hypothetical protein